MIMRRIVMVRRRMSTLLGNDDDRVGGVGANKMMDMMEAVATATMTTRAAQECKRRTPPCPKIERNPPQKHRTVSLEKTAMAVKWRR